MDSFMPPIGDDYESDTCPATNLSFDQTALLDLSHIEGFSVLGAFLIGCTFFFIMTVVAIIIMHLLLILVNRDCERVQQTVHVTPRPRASRSVLNRGRMVHVRPPRELPVLTSRCVVRRTGNRLTYDHDALFEHFSNFVLKYHYCHINFIVENGSFVLNYIRPTPASVSNRNAIALPNSNGENIDPNDTPPIPANVEHEVDKLMYIAVARLYAMFTRSMQGL